jgi:oligosaccharide reducing-end xylanase
MMNPMPHKAAVVAVTCLVISGSAFAQAGPFTKMAPADAPANKSPNSFKTGKYRSLFREIGKTDAEIAAKLNEAWNKLFLGNPSSERVYFEVGPDMAYIKDIGNNDVRSEGMSYGMMLAVQYGRKAEFDRLWKWSKTHMQHARGPWKGYFAWQCNDAGKKLANAPASDGEEYFATALFFAAGRWGSGSGIYNYRSEADAILHHMLHKEEDNGGKTDTVTNMFNRKEKQVVFVPNGTAATFTDPSYHLPAFYELWSRWAKKDRAFWKEAAITSRKYFRKTAHPVTGLTPDYSSFDGKPMKAPWDPNNRSDNFLFDAVRVGGNIAMDHAWFAADPWQVQQSNRMLEFFDYQKPTYVGSYSLDGKPLVEYTPTGLRAMNAASAMASTSPVSKRFVKDLWDAQVPSGQWRYYDGMLYMFGLLHASGQYRIWAPKAGR